MLALAAWNWIKRAWTSLFGVVAHYPWQALCTVLLVLLVWNWHGEHEAVAGRAADRAAYAKAQQDAKALWAKKTAGAEAANAQLNEGSEHDHQNGIETGRVELATYFADRLPRAAQGGAGQPSSAAQGDPATVSGPASSAPTMAFTEAQLRDGWDADYQYGLSCYNWAQGVAKLYDGKHWPAPTETPPTLATGDPR